MLTPHEAYAREGYPRPRGPWLTASAGGGDGPENRAEIFPRKYPRLPPSLLGGGDRRPVKAAKPIIVDLNTFAADYADVSRTTAQIWVQREGLPVLRRRGGRGGAHEIELVPAIRWLRARDKAAYEAELVKGNPAHEAARLRKLQAEARIAEANAAEREGELVDVVSAEQGYARLIGAARERFLSLAPVLVQRALIPHEREGDVAKLVHEALDELAARGEPA
jgi:phage terminase Nu1 subunit (DNA packaging protein)